MSGETSPHRGQLPRWLVTVILLGLYLTFRGYHSFDGDQAYRLPLLFHQQDPKLYAGDPFVRAIDAFNPHRGWLLILDLITRPLGLSCGLFVLFVLTFAATCRGVDRAALGIWPNLAPGTGVVAVALVLAAKAGNIGTNHIFEAMVLDRQVAFALGWLALAQLVRSAGARAAARHVGDRIGNPRSPLRRVAARRGPRGELGGVVFAQAVDGSARCSTVWWLVGLAVAVIPGLAFNLGASRGLMGQMSASDFWQLERRAPEPPAHASTSLADAAMAGVPGLSGSPISRLQVWKGGARPHPIAAEEHPPAGFGWPAARVRLVTSLVVIVAGLAVAWFLIEKRHVVQVTVFQPFRMATDGARNRARLDRWAGCQPLDSRRLARANASRPARGLGHRRLVDGRRHPRRTGRLVGASCTNPRVIALDLAGH